MRHYLFNPTWKCPGNCPECWVRRTVFLDATALSEPEHTLDEWLTVFRNDTPDTLDIAGGEPFTVPWIPEFVSKMKEVKIGLSTNGLLRGVFQLCDYRYENVISINVSFHPSIARWYNGYVDHYKYVVSSLHKVGYHVFCSLVNYGDNIAVFRNLGIKEWLAREEIPLVVAPYEDMNKSGNTLLGGLTCDGGTLHKVFTPGGSVFPCLTALRLPDRWKHVIDNVFSPSYVPVDTKIQGCHLYCYDYYVLRKEHPSGDVWGVNARPCKRQYEEEK